MKTPTSSDLGISPFNFGFKYFIVLFFSVNSFIRYLVYISSYYTTCFIILKYPYLFLIVLILDDFGLILIQQLIMLISCIIYFLSLTFKLFGFLSSKCIFLQQEVTNLLFYTVNSLCLLIDCLLIHT